MVFFPFLSMLGKCSVMTRGMTSVLEQSAAESNQTGDKCDQVRSRTCKRMSHVEFGQASNQCQNVSSQTGTQVAHGDADTLPDSNQSNSAQDIESNNMRDRLFSPVSKKASAKLFSRKVPIKKKKEKKEGKVHKSKIYGNDLLQLIRKLEHY